MTVAAVNWELRPDCRDFDHFESHLSSLLDLAVQKGAKLVVLPENNTYEWLAFLGSPSEEDVPSLLAPLAGRYLDLIASQARWRGITLVGGSCFLQTSQGTFNVCPVGFADQESPWLVPKVKLTQYEITPQKLTAGQGLIRLPQQELGVLVCYDCEFPEAGRIQAESGVKVLAVPAYTETIFGYQRVRWSCLARAIENQQFVIHSSLVGNLGKEPVPETYGSSAIIQPSLSELAQGPGERIVIETALNVEEVVVSSLDFSKLEASRTQGDVRNWQDRDPACWTFTDPRSLAPDDLASRG